MNTEKVTDSLMTDIQLDFFSGEKAHVQILDSSHFVIIETSIPLSESRVKAYDLSKNGDDYQLALISETALVKLSPTQSNTRVKTLEADTSSDIIESKSFTITSSYKNPSVPNIGSINALDNLQFESEKIKAIKELFRSKTLTKDEIFLVLSKISFEDKRAEIVMEFNAQIQGKISENQVEELFKLSRYQTKVLETLNL